MPHEPPPSSPPSLAQPARGDPAAWFGPDDYPIAALRRSAQGRTVARIIIGRDGRVTGCTIASSSGDADLDRATCAVSLGKARYLPARAADGTPIASSRLLPVRWALPSDGGAAPPPGPDRRERDRGWFERVMVAHHLIGGVTAAIAFLGARIRRRLVGGGNPPANRWPDGDRLPARRRSAWRRTRWARIGLAVGPAVLLAAAMAWLGW